jgi:hypothetical protein
MAGDLQAGFTNNINTIVLRETGASSKTYTDRAIDVTGDGVAEVVTEVHVSGHAGDAGGKVRTTITVPTGSARTIVEETTEPDGGVDLSGSEFTVGT